MFIDIARDTYITQKTGPFGAKIFMIAVSSYTACLFVKKTGLSNGNHLIAANHLIDIAFMPFHIECLKFANKPFYVK